MPTAKSFPNPEFSSCLYDLTVMGSPHCEWPQVDQSLRFDSLINQIIWRGSDFDFLGFMNVHEKMNSKWMHQEFSDKALSLLSNAEVIAKLMTRFSDLTPRWKALALTLHDDESADSGPDSNPWINARFTGDVEKDLHHGLDYRGLPVSEKQPMSAKAMSKYKYQIDLAGGTFVHGNSKIVDDHIVVSSCRQMFVFKLNQLSL